MDGYSRVTYGSGSGRGCPLNTCMYSILKEAVGVGEWGRGQGAHGYQWGDLRVWQGRGRGKA